MPYIRVWIHLNWTTKHRQPLFTKDIRYKVSRHILRNARQKGIFLDHINIVDDHVHILVCMRAKQSISSIVHLIKGESSHWINEKNIFEFQFQWQEEYFAISISESAVPQVRRYIRNQRSHHKKK